MMLHETTHGLIYVAICTALSHHSRIRHCCVAVEPLLLTGL